MSDDRKYRETLGASNHAADQSDLRSIIKCTIEGRAPSHLMSLRKNPAAGRSFVLIAAASFSPVKNPFAQD